MPEAVERGRDGYLRVFYDKMGLKFQTYEPWVASGREMRTVNPSNTNRLDKQPLGDHYATSRLNRRAETVRRSAAKSASSLEK